MLSWPVLLGGSRSTAAPNGSLPPSTRPIWKPILPRRNQLALSADWNATIHKLIDALPEELRQPLALSAVDELNSTQISQILKISDGTVRSRLLRARQILKTKLTALTERGRCEK